MNFEKFYLKLNFKSEVRVQEEKVYSKNTDIFNFL